MNTVLYRTTEAQALDLLREMTIEVDDAGEFLSCVTAEDVLDLAIILEDEAMGLYPDAEVYRLAARSDEGWL